jgi:hypothetical protein
VPEAEELGLLYSEPILLGAETGGCCLLGAEQGSLVDLVSGSGVVEEEPEQVVTG